MNRRQFAGLLAGALPVPLFARRLQQESPRAPYLLQLNGYAVDAETPLELLTDYLTPNSLFFVRHHWRPTIPEPREWSLLVDGEVDHPLRLSLTELERLPVSSVTCVLQCAGNSRSAQRPAVPGIQWGHGAVGNAKWTGVLVKELLGRAGVRSTARHLHTAGSDVPPGKVPPFQRSLELAELPEDTLIAYRMNDQALPPLHGAPARLVVPGWAGDHWMKWLTRLRAQAEPQQGFYMDVGYRYPRSPGAPGVAFRPEEMRPVTELFVKATFVQAPRSARLGHAVALSGFAFSGAPDIAKVELSDDEGASWAPARLDPRHDPHAWRRWSYRWTPRQPGRTRLVVRATDSRGAVQPREPVWNQSGYLSNGWHMVEIAVTEAPVEPRAAASAPEDSLREVGTGMLPLPEGAEQPLAQRACLPCHSADVLRQQRLTERQWSAEIAKMRGWGAELSDEESARLLSYLAQHFGPENTGFRPLAVKPLRR